ncbi:carbohydrate porin [Tardiphaga sp.]|uniref:carbohydrate porin n=1 Tax=Tardiphaga sp. TaxID=1926292 RepID=UPI00262D6A68|nr:carbohydrate porin [Tardiphaga sp.]
MTSVYQYEVRDGWTLQPNFQYFVHPGGGATNPTGPTAATRCRIRSPDGSSDLHSLWPLMRGPRRSDPMRLRRETTASQICSARIPDQ